MESIGDKLRSIREARRLSIKDVSKDTNISPMYLAALEEEDFEQFPSETYLIGFLRSYSEYLKLDPEENIQLYKGYKIGESVTPLEELTKPAGPSIPMFFSSLTSKYKNIVFIFVVAVAALLVIWGLMAVLSSDIDITGGDSIENIKDEYKDESLKTKIENIRNLQLQNNRGFILVYKNEAVQFLVDNKEVVFLLKEIEGDKITLEILPGKQVETIEMNKTEIFHIKDCPREILFTLKGLTENRAKIMVLLGKKLDKEPDALVTGEASEKDSGSTEVVAQDNKNLKIVFEAEFIQKSFIELYLDGAKKKRGFVPEGRKERWEAAEYIQIKIGNAGGLKAKINGKRYIFGKSGQVANKVITWKKDVNNPNKYHIVIKDW